MPSISEWLREKRQMHSRGELTDADFAELQQLVEGTTAPHQQILYLHASSPSPLGRVVAMTLLIPGARNADASLEPGEFPYRTVMAAVEDGWRIVQFPRPPTHFSDDTVDYVGFEFVLERFERGYE